MGLLSDGTVLLASLASGMLLIEAEAHAAGEGPRSRETRRERCLHGHCAAPVRRCRGPASTGDKAATVHAGHNKSIVHGSGQKLTVTSVEKPLNAFGTLLVLTDMTKSCAAHAIV